MGAQNPLGYSKWLGLGESLERLGITYQVVPNIV